MKSYVLSLSILNMIIVFIMFLYWVSDNEGFANFYIRLNNRFVAVVHNRAEYIHGLLQPLEKLAVRKW